MTYDIKKRRDLGRLFSANNRQMIMNASKAFTNSAVLYKDGNFMQRRMAYRISCALTEMSGTEVTFATEKPKRNAARLVLKDDKTLAGGNFKITVKGNAVTFSAASYYGYIAISRFLRTEEAAPIYELADGYEKLGNYKDFLGQFEDADRYAYDKRGEVRVMFYNVLFGHYGFRKKEDGKPLRDVPTDKRNPLQAAMVAEYLPDVIGCQEFDRTKRGDFLPPHGQAMKENPHAHLDRLLASIGYKETIARDVGVHPYYNNTPLFYNTKTTKLIKSAYFWYENQIDDENRGNCGVSDCASKAATWGVFEDKKTGKRYIVVSTHMCTRSNGVRGLQAVEVVDLITSLVEKYDAPVFFGGDFNGLPNHANYTYFVSDKANYIDVALNGVAKEFASITRTHHTYPLYNPELDLELVAPDDNTGESLSCIDHIMMTNAENVEVNVYGVVVDECSQSGSDHYPIFADVNL